MGMINVIKAPGGKKDGSQVTWALKRGVVGERLSLMSQPRPGCAVNKVKTYWCTVQRFWWECAEVTKID